MSGVGGAEVMPDFLHTIDPELSGAPPTIESPTVSGVPEQASTTDPATARAQWLAEMRGETRMKNELARSEQDPLERSQKKKSATDPSEAQSYFGSH